MIHLYEQTWEMYLRMMHYTSRRPDYQPYCMLTYVYRFINRYGDYRLLDWGCGENNHRAVLNSKNIVGIDRTREADIYGYPEDVWDQIPRSSAILALNSMHFNLDVFDLVERAMDEKLHDRGEIYLTINNTGHCPASRWADRDRWSQIGEVINYWWIEDHREDMKETLKDHLFTDHLLRGTMEPEQIQAIYNDTVAQTMIHDPWHGILRVHLKK